MTQPLVAVIMGSTSDWPTMEPCIELLKKFNIPYHAQVVSAHRTPDLMATFAKEAAGKGFKVIIAAAGGAAHLPGMVASYTTLPVIGVPVESKSLKGMDSLLSIVQMPAGVPVATVAIGQAGAKNAAILAASMLASIDEKIQKSLTDFRTQRTEDVLANTKLPPQS